MKDILKVIILLSFLILYTGNITADKDIYYDIANNIDNNVNSVITGGFWEDLNRDIYGRYRLIVINYGWEHVSSKVFLQWIQEDNST